MSIEIKITDPHSAPVHVIRSTIEYLESLINEVTPNATLAGLPVHISKVQIRVEEEKKYAEAMHGRAVVPPPPAAPYVSMFPNAQSGGIVGKDLAEVEAMVASSGALPVLVRDFKVRSGEQAEGFSIEPQFTEVEAEIVPDLILVEKEFVKIGARMVESQFTEIEHGEQPTSFVPLPPASVIDLAAFGLVAVTPPVSPGMIVDIEGLPWDSRIHAGSRTTNKDGTWRNKRGVDEGVLNTIKAQLKMALGAPLPPPAPLAPPPPTAPSPPFPPGEAPPAPASVPVIRAPLSFAEFMKMATKQNQVDNTFMRRALDACVAAGLPNLAALHLRPDLIPTVMRTLGCPV